MSGNYHVVYHVDVNKWAVVGENSLRAVALYNTQQEAIQRANQCAGNSGGRVVIHRKSDGTFRT